MKIFDWLLGKKPQEKTQSRIDSAQRVQVDHQMEPANHKSSMGLINKSTIHDHVWKLLLEIELEGRKLVVPRFKPPFFTDPLTLTQITAAVANQKNKYSALKTTLVDAKLSSVQKTARELNIPVASVEESFNVEQQTRGNPYDSACSILKQCADHFDEVLHNIQGSSVDSAGRVYLEEMSNGQMLWLKACKLLQ